MIASPANHRLRLTTVALLAITTLAWLADRGGYLNGLRMQLLSVIAPGRTILLSMSASSGSSDVAGASHHADSDSSDLQNKLLQNELQRRQLLIENAKLRRQVSDLQQADALPTSRPPALMNFVAVQAGVLCRTGMPEQLRELFIDAGQNLGVRRSELVTNHPGIIIDQGRVRGVHEGQKVTQGTAVIGRVSKATRWVAQIQPITDTEFSAAVQIVRRDSPGAAFGARGLLEGTGEKLCRLSGIAYTEAVSVGDEVVSANINGVRGPRLYYGRVVRAEFTDGGQWQIDVEPAFSVGDLDSVLVIQQRVQLPRNTSESGQHNGDIES